jgi:hypothetical protein
MHAILFLAIRALHVGLAALWMGSTVVTSLMVMPAIEAFGPTGGPVMISVSRRIGTYMMVIASMTLMTGVYLLWRFTGGFDAGVIASHAGIAFATGGGAGILAGILGGSVVGRNAKKIADIVERATEAPDGPAGRAVSQQVAALRRRMKSASRAVILLQTTALVLMAVGHYV